MNHDNYYKYWEIQRNFYSKLFKEDLYNLEEDLCNFNEIWPHRKIIKNSHKYSISFFTKTNFSNYSICLTPILFESPIINIIRKIRTEIYSEFNVYFHKKIIQPYIIVNIYSYENKNLFLKKMVEEVSLFKNKELIDEYIYYIKKSFNELNYYFTFPILIYKNIGDY